jgi:aryl-alcohol dehydrogenase-like predicted oxidoreductase
MTLRLLGRTGIKVSTLCLGGDNFLNPTSEEESIRMIDAALAGGITMIDTANSYMRGESERIVGKALKANGRRHQTVVATKVHYPMGDRPNDRGNSRLHIMRAVEDSLQRLGMDHIDLYQTHRPDMSVPLDETLRALDDLVRQGKVRYIGSSTAPAWHVMEAVMTSEMKGYARFVSEQSPYNLLDRRIENELVPMCERHGLGLLCWSPMAMGMLAGRYSTAASPDAESRVVKRGGIYADRVSPRAVEVAERFVALAAEAGMSAAQLAVTWVKDQPGITAALIGPRTLDQLTTLLPVMEMTLSDDLRAACDALVAPGSAVANFFNSAPWMKTKIPR